MATTLLYRWTTAREPRPYALAQSSHPVALIGNAPATPRTARTVSPGPITKLPVELLDMIAWSLPDMVEEGMSTPYRALNRKRPTPRPGWLYALATTCKGFWACLRRLLFEFDVILKTMPFHPEDGLPHWNVAYDFAMSALAWGLANNQTSTAKFAIEVAQSMGRLGSYCSTKCYHYDLPLPSMAVPWRLRWRGRGVDVEMDPLSVAIINGNSKLVKLLTKGADAAQLNRVWPHGNMFSSYFVTVPMTPLNLAVWMEHYGIAKILLQRFAELEQSSLQWNEPSGLSFAAFLGNVEITRLMLDGEEGASPDASPWVARIRSQLLDPRAYDTPPVDIGVPRRHLYDLGSMPPMILASVGGAYPSWRPGGDAIFGLLAAKAPQLVTKPYRRYWRHPAMTPLETALSYTSRGTPFMEPTLTALTRVGALESSPLVSPPTTEQVQHHPPVLILLRAGKRMGAPYALRAVERWWHAALESHGGTADDGFLKKWEEGITHDLPKEAVSKIGIPPHALSELVEEWEVVVEIISLLESEAPGFARRPTIRNWLDRCVFQVDDPNHWHTVGHEDFEGDWNHLRA